MGEPTPLDALRAAHAAALAGTPIPAELYAEAAVQERPFAAKGVPVTLAGRPEIAEFDESVMTDMPVRFTRQRSQHGDHRTVHTTTDPEAIVVQYDVYGTRIASGEPFAFPVIIVPRARDGRIVHITDYSRGLS